MRRVFNTMVLIAVSVIALVACEKQQVDRTSDNYSFEFTSEKPAFDDVVKTEWNGATVLWSSDDKIRVAFTVDDVWQKADGDVTTNSEAQLYASTQAKSDDGFVTANFSVPGNFAPNDGVHEFYALYPSNKVNSNASKFTAPDVKIEVASVQNLSSVTFDSSADVMLGTSGEIPERPDAAIPIRWNRLVAHAYITLADLKDWSEGEVVTSVTLTADPDASMTGDFDLDITTGVSSLKTGNSTANVLTVNNGSLTVVDGDVSFWACMMPCTWKSVQVVVDTDKATYTRQINLTELGKEKTFLQNRRNLLTINMSTADREPKGAPTAYYEKVTSAPADWSGTYLIVCEGANIAMNGSLTSFSVAENYGSVTINEGKIEQSAVLDTYVFSITVDDPEAGTYKLQSSSEYYIGCKTTSFNAAKSYKSDTHANTITYDNEKSCVNIRGLGGYLLQYNSASNSNRFNYFSTEKNAIQLYKRSEDL